MPARTVTLELSEEQARWIDERVEEGLYPDPESAISGALDAHVSEALAVDEAWVREAVLPALERLRADPGRGLTIDEAAGELDRRRAAGAAAR